MSAVDRLETAIGRLESVMDVMGENDSAGNNLRRLLQVFIRPRVLMDAGWVGCSLYLDLLYDDAVMFKNHKESKIDPVVYFTSSNLINGVFVIDLEIMGTRTPCGATLG